jgi:hypothetical protein
MQQTLSTIVSSVSILFTKWFLGCSRTFRHYVVVNKKLRSTRVGLYTSAHVLCAGERSCGPLHEHSARRSEIPKMTLQLPLVTQSLINPITKLT